MKRSITLALGVLAVGATQVASADTIWDSGFNFPVIFNGTLSNLGYISGVSVPVDAEQRWWAEPFSVPAGGCTITDVSLNYFNTRGRQPAVVKYIVWRRVGTTAPVDGDQQASGTLGANTSFGTDVTIPDPGPGGDDPRTPFAEDWTFNFPGQSIVLPAGDYYFTVYGDGVLGHPGLGIPDSVNPYLAWFTGARSGSEANEMAFGWRCSSFPSPGFNAPYAPANVAPQPGQDADDCWNPTFTLKGTGPGLRKVSGVVNLEGYDGFTKPNFVTFEIRQAGTSNVLTYVSTGLGANGEYELNMPMTEGSTFDINVQKTVQYVDPAGLLADVNYGQWLRRTVAGVNCSVSSQVVNFNLLNGDVDDDNEITVGDYAILSANFGGSGAGDLNDDGEVSIGDVALLSGNFGLLGDD